MVKMLIEMGADYSIRAFPDETDGGVRSASSKKAAEGDVPAKQEAALPLDEALRQGHAACAAVIKVGVRTCRSESDMKVFRVDHGAVRASSVRKNAVDYSGNLEVRGRCEQ